jgi:hypothetical protein
MKIAPAKQSLVDKYQKPPNQVHIIAGAKTFLLVAINVMGCCVKKQREDVGKVPLIPPTSIAALL